MNCPWGGNPEDGDYLFTINMEPREKYETMSASDINDDDVECVGVVTSGLYSLIRGRGYGIGQVNTVMITPSNAPNVLRRNGHNQRLVWLERGQHMIPITFKYMK